MTHGVEEESSFSKTKWHCSDEYWKSIDIASIQYILGLVLILIPNSLSCGMLSLATIENNDSDPASFCATAYNTNF